MTRARLVHVEVQLSGFVKWVGKSLIITWRAVVALTISDRAERRGGKCGSRDTCVTFIQNRSVKGLCI